MASQRKVTNTDNRRSASRDAGRPGSRDNSTVDEREIARLRRSVQRFLARTPSDADLTALREGLKAHQDIVERLERHLQEQRRVTRAETDPIT
jgi:hypothetical protein